MKQFDYSNPKYPYYVEVPLPFGVFQMAKQVELAFTFDAYGYPHGPNARSVMVRITGTGFRYREIGQENFGPVLNTPEKVGSFFAGLSKSDRRLLRRKMAATGLPKNLVSAPAIPF